MIIKTLHILSAAILFGTGLGIAFFMLSSQFYGQLTQKYFAARTTVMADYLFTAPAIILQPLTGLWLIQHGGYDPNATWLMWTYILYGITVACWLPVVWIQIRLKQILRQSIDSSEQLPPRYGALFKIWFLLGWPAFFSLVGIFFLMVAKPT